MERALPPAIVALLEDLGTALVQWSDQHRDQPLAVHEDGVLALVRGVLPRLLEAVLQRSTTTLAPHQQRRRETCAGCGARLRVRRWHPRQVLTRCGPIRYTRPAYECRRCRQSACPTDACLGVAPHARLSAGVQATLGRLGALMTFAEARTLLAELAGLTVSRETIRQQSTQQGAALLAGQQQARAHVAARREAAPPVVRPRGELLVETDGVLVRFQDGWHEVKVGLVAGWADGHVQQPSYVAAREPAEAFGPRLLTEAARRGALEIIGWEGGGSGRGLAVLPPVLVLGDGAPWIWNLAGEQFGARTEIVDYYHAAEHVWTLARALHGAGTEAATAWARAHCTVLYEQGGSALRRRLQRTRGTTPEAREALRLERGYFRTNADRMDYPALRARGLPIGSGAIESAARHVVQQRFKRPGMRWSIEGGQALLALRAHFQSRDSLAA